LEAQKHTNFIQQFYDLSYRYKTYHGRIAYYIQANTLQEALVLAKHGYRIYPSDDGKYICELPEQSIIDLSDVYLPFSYTLEYPIKVYSYIKKNIKSILATSGNRFKEVYGEALEGQVRIAGESSKALKNFVSKFLSKLPCFLEDDGSGPRLPVTPLLKGLPKKEWCFEVKKFLRTTQKMYEKFCLPQYQCFFRVYNCNEAFAHFIWKEIRKMGKTYVFILQGGLSLALGFIQVTKDSSKVRLIERHKNEDSYSCFRSHKLLKAKFGEYEVKPSTLIIDKVYTGNTLREIKEEEPRCRFIGLLPKSRKAFDFLDWIVFNSCLIPVHQVPDNKDWFIELYMLTEEIRRKSLKIY